jgi:hypothetical protein
MSETSTERDTDGSVIFGPDALVDNNLQLVIDLTAGYRTPAIYGGVAQARWRAA